MNLIKPMFEASFFVLNLSCNLFHGLLIPKIQGKFVQVTSSTFKYFFNKAFTNYDKSIRS